MARTKAASELQEVHGKLVNVLGLDPGSRDGAAVVVRNGVAIRWWTWRYLRAKGGRYAVTRGQMSGVDKFDLPTMHDVGRSIASGGPFHHAVIEGLYTPPANGRRRVNPQSVIPLAEACGEVMGPIKGVTLGDLYRPLASEWRRKVLRLGRATAAQAEQRAIREAMSRLVWVADPSEVVSTKELGAVCEASMMALWVPDAAGCSGSTRGENE